MLKSLLFWLRVALVIVPLGYAANFYYAVHSNQTGGTFGDTFGAANALFSGAALMMLIYAVILQREELSLVKDERNDTRRLLEGQEDITRAQKEALDIQLFEMTLSSYLRLLNDERERLLSETTHGSIMSVLQTMLSRQRQVINESGNRQRPLSRIEREYIGDCTRTDTFLERYRLCIGLIESAPVSGPIKAQAEASTVAVAGKEIYVIFAESLLRSAELRNFVSDADLEKIALNLPHAIVPEARTLIKNLKLDKHLTVGTQ